MPSSSGASCWSTTTLASTWPSWTGRRSTPSWRTHPKATRTLSTPNTKGLLVKEKALRAQLSRIGTAAGIGHVTGYDLRHTGATLIAENHGEDISSKALDHVGRRSKITAGYIHRRRLETVLSAVLDLAIAEAKKQAEATAADQEAAQ